MKNNILNLVGVLAVVTAIGLNVRHALNHYGVLDNENLHMQVLAQATTTDGNGSGGNSGGNSGGDTTTGSTGTSGSTTNWGVWDAIKNLLSGQGLFMDEREWPRVCPTSSSSTGAGAATIDGVGGLNISTSSSQVNPDSRYEITCPYGEVNCTAIKC